MAEFSERFKELRIANGNTQAQLAKIFHTTSKTISTWESGTRHPRDYTPIAGHFGVSTDYLMGVSDIPHPYPLDATERGVLISDDSFAPEIRRGDTVYFNEQDTAMKNGDIVVCVGGFCRRYYYFEEGELFIRSNGETEFYSDYDDEKKPNILGTVLRMTRTYKKLEE